MGTTDSRDADNLHVRSATASDGGIILQVEGELDLSTVTMFVEALDALLDGEPVQIEVDMSELTFIDSSGVGAYVTAYRRAQAKGSRLKVGARSGLVQRVLELSGVEEALAQETADKP
ncbi:MAG: anti-sigma factor antagonist [Acidimicrobiaceae bacterium]